MEKLKLNGNWSLYVLLDKIRTAGYKNTKLVVKQNNKSREDFFGHITNKEFFIALAKENHLVLSMDKDDSNLAKIISSVIGRKPIKRKESLMGSMVYEWIS